MNRRYFILENPQPDQFQSLEACIGKMWTQRYSLNGACLLIKTNQDIIDNYFKGDVSLFGSEYTINEIKVIMQSDAWQVELDF
jgi:hypothetical protein